MRRAHDPSGFRGRGPRLGRHPQQQCGDAGGLRGQCKFAAGDEIELTGLPPDFQHDGADGIAGQRVGGGPQCASVSGARTGTSNRIETEFTKPAQRQRTDSIPKNPAAPRPAAARRYLPARPAMTARGRRALVARGEHFMHRGDRKTALQRRIRCRMAERDLVEIMRIAMRLDPLDAPAQTCKRACACGAHAPLLQGNLAFTAFS